MRIKCSHGFYFGADDGSRTNLAALKQGLYQSLDDFIMNFVMKNVPCLFVVQSINYLQLLAIHRQG